MKDYQRLQLEEHLREQRLTIAARRWVWVLGSALIMLLLSPRVLTSGLFLFLLAVFVAINLLYTKWLYSDTAIGSSPQSAYLLTYVMDCAFTAVLIYSSGGLTSPFIMNYAILLIGLVPSRPVFRDVSLFGGVAYLSYVIVLALYYGGGAFLTQPFFWVECLFMAGVFFNVVSSTRVIMEKNVRLATSKEALEKFADGLKSTNERLERLSVTDGLTGLYNFRYFQLRLKEEVNRTRRYHLPLALIMLDVDGFKKLNDTYGHQTGDKILQGIANVLQQNVRELDTVARYGGDEFAVILADADAELALVIADRIRKAIGEARFDGIDDGTCHQITSSLGVAVFPDNASTADELVRKADDALYRVKLSRKNRVQLYSGVMDELRVELRSIESSTALLNTMQTLITVINARDRYTYGHSERVVKYATALGETMGLSQDNLRFLKYAAFLHDIGKIEIGREVLNKRGPLNDDEMALIRQHTLFGVNIIEPIKGLERISPCVLYHHERYDGRGYPAGLRGSQIPLEARILSVADSFDAMMSNRPYRDALSLQECLAELQRNAGSQFDPAIVGVFLAVVDEVERDIQRGAC